MIDSFPVIGNIVDLLSKLPGVGEKTALKYSLWLVEHKEDSKLLSSYLNDLGNKVKLCRKCRNLTLNDDGLCDICKDSSRDGSTVCVVENIENFFAIESSSIYNGMYYILGSSVSSYGVDIHNLGLDFLINRIFQENVREVILVISSTIEGDLITQYIKERLKNSKVDITRIAYGIPVGVNVNFIDRTTLVEAFKSRRAV